MKYDATVIYCNEHRQPEPLLVVPQDCESTEEFMDFLYTLLESVIGLNPKDEIEKVLHAIETHAYTEEEFEEDGEEYTNVSIFVA